MMPPSDCLAYLRAEGKIATIWLAMNPFDDNLRAKE
jgi:hypothetical protein